MAWLLNFHVGCHNHVHSSVAAALAWEMPGRLSDLVNSAPKLACAAEQPPDSILEREREKIINAKAARREEEDTLAVRAGPLQYGNT